MHRHERIFEGVIDIDLGVVAGRPAMQVRIPLFGTRVPRIVPELAPGALAVYEVERGEDYVSFVIEYLEGGWTLDGVLRRFGERVGRYAGAPCPGCGRALEARLIEIGFQLLCDGCGAMFDPAAAAPARELTNGALLGSPMPPEVATSIAIQAIEVLAGVAPSRWSSSLSLVVHLAGDGAVRLVDFGVLDIFAAFYDDPDAPLPDLVQLYRYMSPEVCFGGAIAERTSVYNAGAMLYELASGRHPSEPWTYQFDFVRAIRDRGFEPIAEIAGPLGQLIERAMAREDAARPSLGELAAELNAIAGPPDRAAVARFLEALGPPPRTYPEWPVEFR